MIVIILLIVIAAVLTIIGWICLFRNKDTIAFICFVLVISIWIGGTFYSNYDTNDTPTALDVYRGKTTLEITYRDSVAVDSVVVYKMK